MPLSTIPVINPATNQEIARFEPTPPDQVTHMIQSVHQRYLDWKKTSLEERRQLCQRLGEVLRKNKEAYAQLMTEEMGKVLSEARAEVDKCARLADYYAQEAPRFLALEPIATEAQKSYVAFRPLGVVLAVMPWNFPFWQVLRFAIPAILAGNTALLKHASNVPGCSQTLEAIFLEAGFPESTFRSLLIKGSEVAQVIGHPLVKAVTLTGSTPAGKAVAQKAGEMLKKTVLELGGSDPYLILEDADLEWAAQVCVKSRLINAGQSCIAAKRFIVVASVAATFEHLVLEELKKVVLGSPQDPNSHIGPLARMDLRDEVHQQVEASKKAGAKCLWGGYIPAQAGAYYPPTLLTEVKPGNPAFEEEIFGPVASIIRAQDEAEAIQLANQSVFGLGAAVFTQDVARGQRIAEEDLEAGCCFVNDFVRSDPRLPFGGIKESGYGRELSSFGIREFVNIKTVYVK